MRAVVYDAFQSPPEVRTVPDPDPAADGVVVEVEATGLCRSDWHGWMGHDPDVEPPQIPGHELAGTVAAVGEQVERWTVGDRVTVPFVSGCGRCEECAAGHPQVCPNQYQPGFTGPGSFAEYVPLRYADTNLVALPPEVAFDTAASLGCRFGTAFRAVVDQGEVRAGEWVAVHGCGGVGLSAVMIARAAGAQVVAVDVQQEALERAQALGAAAGIDASTAGDVPQAVRDHTGGGAHLSIDAVGRAETAFHSVAGLRRRGRHVQVGLLTGDDAHAALPMDRVIAEELDVRGVHGIQSHRYAAILDLVQSGALSPERLIGTTRPLADAPAALSSMTDSDTPAGITIIHPRA